MHQGPVSPPFALWLVSRPTSKLELIPVKDVIVGKALTVEQVAEELAQVRIIRLIVKAEGATEVQVCCKLS